MIKERRRLPLSELQHNEGQIPWLPDNPRRFSRDDLRRTRDSLKRDPDFLEDRPLLVVEHEGKYVIFAGNLRYAAAKDLRMADLPAVLYTPEGKEDTDTIVRRSLLDNGSFGSWDFDKLANEWDDLPLAEFGVPVWDVRNELEKGLTTEGRQGNAEYDAFVEKFDKEAPLTTDDCYTPPKVYDAIVDFVDKRVIPLAGRRIIRPFYPNGDYEKEEYPEGCVVIDNPPFSIISKIVRFYADKGIDFFIFAPALTLFSGCSRDGVCYCVFSCDIVYENGAVVNTGFITNMKKGVRVWVDSELGRTLKEVQKKEPTNPIYNYPDNVVTAARLQKVANGGSLEILESESVFVRDIKNAQEYGKGLFGAGFLISTEAAERVKAATEVARQEAEKERLKKRGIDIPLTDEEKAVVARLDRKAGKNATP